MEKKWRYIQQLIRIMAGQKKGFAGKQKTQDGFTIKMSGKACAVILCRGGLNTGGIVI